jgi:succinate-semialdehyde dehydrogenase/glutarate-semialdehyde dehydrogenase
VTFTGSTAVGQSLARLAAEGVKPCTLELGGHAPVLIFDDANLERTVATCIMGKTRNAGQVCTSPTRFYVQEGIYPRFLKAFSQAMEKVIVGEGMANDSQMGPLANKRRLQAISHLIDEAVDVGAKISAGGKRQGENGFFFRPTVLTSTPMNAQVINTEPFGPIALVDSFVTLEEGLERANNNRFGLAAYAFTQSSDTAVKVSEGLEAGGIGINSFAVSHIEAPFGGLKDSGYGHEGGSEGLEAFMHQKYVHHA